jgi:putative transposase
MEKFKNKYRIPSARAQWWDYSRNGAYFITICTQHRVHYFGEIVLSDAINDINVNVETRLIASLQESPRLIQNPYLQSTVLGELAEQIWYEIPSHFAFIQLDAFVVMPNHLHGILLIKNDNVDRSPPEQKTGGFAKNKNPMLNENISRVVRWFKGRCAFEMRKCHAGFKWQSRFHDHIIRDDSEYQRINNYIETNPQNWEIDKFFTPGEL